MTGITLSAESDAVPAISCIPQLIAAGHSMGGSQAELFSACANRDLKGNEEVSFCWAHRAKIYPDMFG